MKNHYFNILKDEIFKDKYQKTDLLKDKYLINKLNDIEIYYAPFEYVNREAKVVIVGITPGWTQMEKSFSVAVGASKNLITDSDILKLVKVKSSFAGSMRNNLIKMLDDLELNFKLNLSSCQELFKIDNHFLHSTSALKYPVFKKDKNYTGSSPSAIKNKLLWSQIEENLIPELSNFKNKLIIPLGKNVNDILFKLKLENKLNNNIILEGFPHPSGANGHRVSQFNAHKALMMEMLRTWEIN